MAKPHFVELKRSYTELHSELTVRAPGEQPTLCLSEFFESTRLCLYFLMRLPGNVQTTELSI
jgi:hypothetical protein